MSNKNYENKNVKSGLEKMKNEVSNELGVNLKDENLTSREAGKVGGEMTKRLISMAEDKLS